MPFSARARPTRASSTFQGSVRVDGNFTGEIVSEGTLIVGKDAKVEGPEIKVGQLILSGLIQGEIDGHGKKVVLHTHGQPRRAA